jgi:hypothetical protein
MTTQGRARLDWMNALLESDDERIDTHTIAVAFVLYRHMDRGAKCRPSTRRIAEMARCTRNAVMDKISRLEAAGFLIVERHHRAPSTFRAAIDGTMLASLPDTPSGSPGGQGVRDAERESGSRSGSRGEQDVKPAEHLANEVAHEDGQFISQMASEPSHIVRSGSPGGPQGRTTGFPSSSSPTTHDAPPGAVEDDEPRAEYDRARDVLKEMARRSLENERFRPGNDAPPPNSAREKGWLNSAFHTLAQQHGPNLNAVLREFPDVAADYVIWRLNPALANRNHARPTAEDTRRRLDAEHAEWAEAMADDTPEAKAARRAGLDAFKARIKRNKLLALVPEVADEREAS